MNPEPNPALRALWDADMRAGIDPFAELAPAATRPKLEPALREDTDARPAKPLQRTPRTPRIDAVRGWRQADAS